MRRIETKYDDGGHESTLAFPDAYSFTHDPDVPVKERLSREARQQVLEELREEIIAALNDRRPPILFVPPGLKLTVHEAVKMFRDEDDEEEDEA